MQECAGGMWLPGSGRCGCCVKFLLQDNRTLAVELRVVTRAHQRDPSAAGMIIDFLGSIGWATYTERAGSCCRIEMHVIANKWLEKTERAKRACEDFLGLTATFWWPP